MEDLKKCYEMSSVAWKFFKDHYIELQNTADKDVFWKKTVAESKALGEKYNNNHFISHLLYVMTEELYEYDKKSNKGNKSKMP